MPGREDDSAKVKAVGASLAYLGLLLSAGFFALLTVALAFPWSQDTPYLLGLGALLSGSGFWGAWRAARDARKHWSARLN